MTAPDDAPGPVELPALAGELLEKAAAAPAVSRHGLHADADSVVLLSVAIEV